MMTVKELRDMLEAADPDAEVYFREIYGEPDFDDGYKITGMVYGIGRVDFTNEDLS